MYELAKKSREAMKSKAHRLASATDRKVDSSTWRPSPPINADKKTGARPIAGPSAKGVGESNVARDAKAALGSAHRGAFKSGGGVKDKKALGAIDPSPKRGPAGHYKDGGWIKDAIKKPGALHKQLGVPEGEKIPAKKLEAAADKGGKLGKRARLAETLKGFGKCDGGAMRPGRKSGGSAPNLTVIVADKGQNAAQPQGPAGARPMPVPMPSAVPPATPPMPMMQPPAVPPSTVPPSAQPPIKLRTGGRAVNKADSYKGMAAGSGSGEGRLQKADVAKKHKNAPARKSGGRATA